MDMIHANFREGTVVWTMDPGTARDVADFIESSLLPPRDLAKLDAEALRRAIVELERRDG